MYDYFREGVTPPPRAQVEIVSEPARNPDSAPLDTARRRVFAETSENHESRIGVAWVYVRMPGIPGHADG